MQTLIIGGASEKDLRLIQDFVEKRNTKAIPDGSLETFLTLSAGQHELFRKKKNPFELKPARYFDGPLLEMNVEIEKEFSIDGRICPKQEVKYSFVSDYVRDQYFNQEIFTGKSPLAKLQIVKTRDGMSVEESIKLARKEMKGRKDLSKFTVRTLHNILRDNPTVIDPFKDRVIIVPLKSSVAGPDGRWDVLCLYWFGAYWWWYYDWLTSRLDAGFYVALLSQ